MMSHNTRTLSEKGNAYWLLPIRYRLDMTGYVKKGTVMKLEISPRNSGKKIVVFALLLIVVFFGCTACNDEEDVSGNPEVTPYSEEIYVSGEWLYYDGSRRDAGLFAYNLETGDKVKITGQQGTLLKTSHGFFYHVGMKVYQIREVSLEFLCVIPKNAIWVDHQQGNAYWIGEREALYRGEISFGGLIREESVKTLYRRAEGEGKLGWVRIMEDRAYLGRRDGVYLLGFETLKTESIWEGDMQYWLVQAFEGDYAFVQSNTEIKELSILYLKDDTVQTIAETDSDFALFYEGTVYYNNLGKNGGIRAYDLSDGSDRYLGKGFWCNAAGYYDHYLILRSGENYGIYRLDVLDGSVERLVDM